MQVPKITTVFYFLLFTFYLSAITSCSVNDAKIDNSLKKYFDNNKVDGSFTILNNAGEITVYNLAIDTAHFLPASTFEIVNSLIGLETGIINDEKMVIKWDGIKRREDWDKDMSMEEAFKVGCLPYYQEVARRNGRDTMRLWIDSLHYGNMDISSPIDTFWLNNTLKISPDEQVGLVKRLYFDQLPFQRRSQEIVGDAMMQEDNSLYKFCYKTGVGYDENHNSIGWVVGWVEENKHPYFFATLVKSANPDIKMKAVGLNITKGILTQLGFFKGQM